jgi:hypothetical protein
MSPIDAPEYQLGRRAFREGASLREIVDRVIAASEQDETAEAKAFSRALGFADAFLDMVRGIER